ncbi:MAG: hypothetical protein ACTHNN_01190 [Xanthobacteraceae bacterium]
MKQPALDFRVDMPAPGETGNEIVDNIPAVTVIMDVISGRATR